MENFGLQILGCGSALPTRRHLPSAQVITHHSKLFMIDCGEGTQIQFRAMNLGFRRLNHIFLSHLHGDHCFGLPGLISSMGMLGRTADLHVYAQPEAPAIFQPILDYFCNNLSFNVCFHDYDPLQSAVIYEDRNLRISTLPLLHRVPCAGFLLEEKPGPRHIVREMTDFYRVPYSKMAAIKQGADFVTPDGTVIPCDILTRPPTPPRRYAYCSDTAYCEELIPLIAGADLLYHEATYLAQEEALAAQYLHSSARQAARLAKEAGVGQLLLGHFSARYANEHALLAEARDIFPPTLLANEGIQLSIGL
jgi:ribonuclease Z